MIVKIKCSYSGTYPVNLEKRVRKLLKSVPERYLRGLKLIILVNTISHQRFRNAEGLYLAKTKSESARVELAIDTIYKGVPKIFMLAPFFAKYFLARVLFHEIGHHYQYENKNMKMKYRENYADKISDDLLLKHFNLWRILFFPFRPLVTLMKKLSKQK